MLESRIQPRCKAYMKRLFLDRTALVRQTEHVQDTAKHYGITDLTILKVRRDRVIARGEHPDWGRVAIKSTDPFLDSVPANSAHHTDSLVASDPALFLPHIHACGLGHSVSEWIEGRHLHDVDQSSCESLPVTQFVDALGQWCSRKSAERPLAPSAITSIVRFYVETTVRRMGYHSVSNCIRACVAFRRHAQRLTGYVEEMVGLASEVQLDETLMFSDVQTWNVLYSQRDARLVLVDHEALRPGNWLFDAVFWFSSLMIYRVPRPVLYTVAGHLFSRNYMPAEETARFFRSFAAYVVETFMTIDGCGRAEIEPNLDIIEGAMAGQ